MAKKTVKKVYYKIYKITFDDSKDPLFPPVKSKIILSAKQDYKYFENLKLRAWKRLGHVATINKYAFSVTDSNGNTVHYKAVKLK